MKTTVSWLTFSLGSQEWEILLGGCTCNPFMKKWALGHTSLCLQPIYFSTEPSNSADTDWAPRKCMGLCLLSLVQSGICCCMFYIITQLFVLSRCRRNNKPIHKVITFCEALTGSESNWFPSSLFASVLPKFWSERWACGIQAYT